MHTYIHTCRFLWIDALHMFFTHFPPHLFGTQEEMQLQMALWASAEAAAAEAAAASVTVVPWRHGGWKSPWDDRNI
jgi:hypothetical protein